MFFDDSTRICSHSYRNCSPFGEPGEVPFNQTISMMRGLTNTCIKLRKTEIPVTTSLPKILQKDSPYMKRKIELELLAKTRGNERDAIDKYVQLMKLLSIQYKILINKDPNANNLMEYQQKSAKFPQISLC